MRTITHTLILSYTYPLNTEATTLTTPQPKKIIYICRTKVSTRSRACAKKGRQTTPPIPVSKVDELIRG